MRPKHRLSAIDNNIVRESCGVIVHGSECWCTRGTVMFNLTSPQRNVNMDDAVNICMLIENMMKCGEIVCRMPMSKSPPTSICLEIKVVCCFHCV